MKSFFYSLQQTRRFNFKRLLSFYVNLLSLNNSYLSYEKGLKILSKSIKFYNVLYSHSWDFSYAWSLVASNLVGYNKMGRWQWAVFKVLLLWHVDSVVLIAKTSYVFWKYQILSRHDILLLRQHWMKVRTWYSPDDATLTEGPEMVYPWNIE